MKKQIVAAAVAIGALGGAVVGCTSTTTPTPATTCSAVASAQANPTFTAQMATISQQSAVGQLWTYVQSGCVAGQPVAGVTATWTQQILAMLESALPTVLPMLVGLI